MKISESFIKDIIESEFPDNYQLVYDNSNLIQYLDKKMGAVHGDSKKKEEVLQTFMQSIRYCIFIKTIFIINQMSTGSLMDMII